MENAIPNNLINNNNKISNDNFQKTINSKKSKDKINKSVVNTNNFRKNTTYNKTYNIKKIKNNVELKNELITNTKSDVNNLTNKKKLEDQFSLENKLVNNVNDILHGNINNNIETINTNKAINYLVSQKIEKSFKVDNEYITFSSNFDSGNLKSVIQTKENKPYFELELLGDCEDISSVKTLKNRSWFFFSIILNNKIKHKCFNLTLKNILNQSKNYCDGYKPVYLITENKEMHDWIPDGKTYNEDEFLWKRISSYINVKSTSFENFDNPNIVIGNRSKLFTEINFDFVVDISAYSIYFAFCYPYSYNRIINFCNKLCNDVNKNNSYINNENTPYTQKNNKLYNYKCNYINNNDNNIYIHKELLTYSKQNRKIELITLSSYDQITNQREQSLKGLFPDLISNENKIKESNVRCFSFSTDKPIIFISARVHPAETTASYTLEGLLKFLTNDKDLRSYILRKFFVFKIIPVINPDGVSNGYYRFDSNGFNLNRHYMNPELNSTPEVYAIKRLFVFYSQHYRVKHFFDFHGHFSMKGHFLFMNNMDFLNQIESLCFPFLLSSYNKDFNYRTCSYAEKSMKSKEYGDMFTKEGCSRVHFYKLTGINTCYTVEASGFKKKNFNYNKLCDNNTIKDNDLDKFDDFDLDRDYNFVSSDKILLNYNLVLILNIDLRMFIEYESLISLNDNLKESNYYKDFSNKNVFNLKHLNMFNFEQLFDLKGNYKYQSILKEDINEFYTIQCYYKLAVDLMNSLLDYEDINPYIINKDLFPNDYCPLLINYFNNYSLYNKKNNLLINNEINKSSLVLNKDNEYIVQTVNNYYLTNSILELKDKKYYFNIPIDLIRTLIALKLIKDDEKFRHNLSNKTFSTNIENTRKKNTIMDKIVGKSNKRTYASSNLSTVIYGNKKHTYYNSSSCLPNIRNKLIVANLILFKSVDARFLNNILCNQLNSNYSLKFNLDNNLNNINDLKYANPKTNSCKSNRIRKNICYIDYENINKVDNSKFKAYSSSNIENNIHYSSNIKNENLKVIERNLNNPYNYNKNVLKDKDNNKNNNTINKDKINISKKHLKKLDKTSTLPNININ